MINIILFKRGSSPKVEAYTGDHGELVYDRGRGALRLHDGNKLGGFLLGSNNFVQTRPTIVSPANGAVDLPRQINITVSPYQGEGTHTATRWQASLDADMTNNVVDGGWDTDHLTSVQIDCPSNSVVFLRCQFQIDGEYATAWSDIISVTTNEGWLTRYTAYRETSHLTERSVMTVASTRILDYKQTFRLNARQTFNEGGNYSRETIRNTNTIWSTLVSSAITQANTTKSYQRTTTYSRQTSGAALTEKSTSRMTQANVTSYETRSTSGPILRIHETSMSVGSAITSHYTRTTAFSTAYREAAGARNTSYETYYNTGQGLTNHSTSRSTVVYIDTVRSTSKNTVDQTISTANRTTRFYTSYTVWITSEEINTVVRSTTISTSYMTGTTVEFDGVTHWNALTKWSALAVTSWSTVQNRTTSRATQTTAETNWTDEPGYSTVFETDFWQTSTFRSSESSYETIYNYDTYYNTLVETESYTG